MYIEQKVFFVPDMQGATRSVPIAKRADLFTRSLFLPDTVELFIVQYTLDVFETPVTVTTQQKVFKNLKSSKIL